MSHKILVAQGGGPTAVINQSLAGVALEARRFPDVTACLRRAAGRARHRQRRSRRSRPGDGRQPRSGRRDPGRGARLDPRQAGPQILPGNLQGPESPRDRHVLLYRRQRFLRHRAHRRRGGQDVRSWASRRPYSEDHRQRSGRLRPHAGLSVGGALRRAGLRRRQSRQSGAEGRLCRRGDGPARRLPHRGLGAGAQISRRRPPSHLSARAHLRRRQVPRRREDGLRASRPLHRRRLRRHPRREGRGDHHQAHGRRRRRTRTATSSSPAPARSPISCARRSRRSSASNGCAATRSAICSARSSAASARSISAKRARSARRRCNMRLEARATARSRFAASPTTRSTIR